MARTLLIVDDLRSNREILKNMLGREYEIAEASNGEDALAILLEHHDLISAVLLDISMPRLNGYEVLSKIRSNALLAAIPVIMITGSENEEARIKALSYGANDFVMKPYSSEILRHCLNNNIALHEAAVTMEALRRDKITGLYNRETFFEKVKRSVFHHEPGYYVMTSFDIDKFRIINDQYGTEKGDEVLRHVAETFMHGFDPHGGICCRVSADNFAVLYPASFQDSDEIAAIRKKATCIDGLIFPITFSIGRYVIEDITLTPSAMYDRATLAASTVKGRYDSKIAIYNEKMREQIIREQRIVSEMEYALKNRQFEVWFQPQYNHATDALIGSEALVRWRHPDNGLIFPDKFIPIFEQNGFIYELDKFVWEEVGCFLRKWLDEGRSPLPVSVNISRYDIFREDIVNTISGIVKKYALPVDLLRLEVTESAFSKDLKHVVGVVKDLLEFGFTIEIDDFGSGYSSLNTLKDVPAQILKLDMKFFENSGDSQRGGNIVESIVRMAKWLGMSVIAEGVETLAQANFLRSIGCYYIQGYLYAKPMPAKQYEAHCIGSAREEKLIALETVENLNNNSFWDAKSMDTLIFNSYVGAACIFEYHNGNVELIRATEKYAQVIGSAGMRVEDALKISWSDHMNQDSQKRAAEAMETSIREKKEITDEYIFLDLPGCPHETYLRSTIRVIATTGDRYLVYCTNENITAQRESEKREREASEQLRAIMKSIDNGVSAAVIENGKFHPVFANDCYFKMLGYSRAAYEKQYAGIPIAVLPEDRAAVLQKAAAIDASQKPDQIEFRVLRADGAVRLLKSSISLMEYPGIRKPVQLSITNDITEQREAEQKILRLSDQMKSIMDHVDLGIIASVVENGTARYLFSNDYYYKMLGYTSDQFAKEVTSPYQTIAQEDRARMMEATQQLNLSGGSAAMEYFAITKDGNKRVFRTIISIGSLSGVDAPVQLSILRDITEEKALEQRERESAAQLQAMMNDIPGGFVRMRMDDDGSIKPIYFNKGFSELTGMNYDELMALYRDNAFAGVHPDDVEIVKRAVSNMMERSEVRSSRYRLKHKNGDYIWLMFFGRITTGENDQIFLNIYYLDATKEVKALEQSKELLDNLPYGAAIYAVTGNALSLVYLNKRYWELVGRSETEYAGDAFLNAVYPEDHAIVSHELDIALKEKRDISCNIRILCRGNTYRPFHIAGRAQQKESGQYVIYAVYTPITNESMSIQETLPIALSAMMDAQTDYSFVKDKNMRYICCSRGAADLVELPSAAQIIGKTDYELFSQSLADKLATGDRRVLEKGEAVLDQVLHLPTADGSGRYISLSKYPLKDTPGNIVGLYGVGRDITESRAIKSQYELLTNSIPGGIATYEAEDNLLRVTFFSDGFCRLFGLTRAEYTEIGARNVFAGIFEEDIPALQTQLNEMIRHGAQADCIFRVRLRSGEYKWINLKAACAEKIGDKLVFNAVLFDVTQQQDAIEHLRISEEEKRLALEHTSNTVCRYDVASSTLHITQRAQDEFQLPETIADVPLGQIKSGLISPETAEAYRTFYDGIHSGKKSGSVTFQRLSDRGWRWLEGHFSAILAVDGNPVWAVISFSDVTEQLEKAIAYKRWQQSYLSKPSGSYSLFRCSVRKETTIDAKEGTLIAMLFKSEQFNFDEHTAAYAASYVIEEDVHRFSAFLNVDALLSCFYQGKRIVSLEYREKIPSGDYRWLRLSVDLVEHESQTGVEAYLLFEDIDKVKRQELETIAMAQTDPLTGVLNRTTFAMQVNSIIQSAKPDSQFALMMLDIDGFKQVNDAFGHGAGDQTLIYVAESLRKLLRHEDLIGRLGGDEYLVFLTDIPGDLVAAAKAKQICAAIRRSFSAEIEITGSIGIAVTQRDGSNFETLYKKADAALYHVKGSGKDSFAFYHEDMADHHLSFLPHDDETNSLPRMKKRRILIVDDSRIDHALLSHIFADEFIVEKAKNGNDALIRLRHYGIAISIVLLDLFMPGMDGFEVLKKMQESKELQRVPVIVVSGDDSRETGIRAIRAGAVDFVNKPVDPEILRVRVHSAISKAENERLRAKNTLLEYQNSEIARYKVAMECGGVVVIENDWIAGTFIYDPAITERIAGRYDDRGFWRIILSDFVAETFTAQKMQNLVQEVAASHSKKVGQTIVRLKTPKGNYHWFRMCVSKKTNELGLTGKLYMTFVDLGTEKGNV